MRAFLKKVLPTAAYDFLRLLRHWREWPAAAEFLFRPLPGASFRERLAVVRQSFRVSFRVSCPHTQREVLSYARTMLSLPHGSEGVVVEAGCYKGGSTAKFSMVADLADRELVVFDSFCGIPPNVEHLQGGPKSFHGGSFCGTFDEVTSNVTKYGKIDRCRFIQGWFDDTMPDFHEPIAAAYIDVDLVSSTKTCLKYLFPLLQPGGVLHSQDGHLPLVIEVFDDDSFWENEVGCKKPRMLGLGTSKLITVFKETNPAPATRETHLASRR